MKFILICVTLDLSDNLTETPYHEKFSCADRIGEASGSLHVIGSWKKSDIYFPKGRYRIIVSH